MPKSQNPPVQTPVRDTNKVSCRLKGFGSFDGATPTVDLTLLVRLGGRPVSYLVFLVRVTVPTRNRPKRIPETVFVDGKGRDRKKNPTLRGKGEVGSVMGWVLSSSSGEPQSTGGGLRPHVETKETGRRDLGVKSRCLLSRLLSLEPQLLSTVFSQLYLGFFQDEVHLGPRGS